MANTKGTLTMTNRMIRIEGYNLIPAVIRTSYEGQWSGGGRTYARPATRGERPDGYIVCDCARPVGVVEGERGDWAFRKFAEPAGAIMDGAEKALQSHLRCGKTRREAMVAGGLL